MKLTEYTIKVDPDGSIYFLYNDDSPLRELGKMQSVRASHVEWSVEEQAWVVWINEPTLYVDPFNGLKEEVKPLRKRLDHSFKNRDDAIQAEINVLNDRLANGVDIKALFN